MDKKLKLSEDDKLRLIGLKTLAENHWKQLEAIRKSAAAITGEKSEYGHTDDWLSDANDNRSPDELFDVVHRM